MSQKNRNLSDTGELKNFIPIFLSSFGLGMAFGGYIPLVSLWLNILDISFSSIGLITGASSIGVIVSAYLGPRIVKKSGYLNGAISGIVLASVAGIFFRFSESEFFWILLRVIAGLGFGLHWVISEAWLGQLVSNKNRTRAMSLYVVSMALGFSAGPVIIWVTGISSPVPFFIIGILQIISVLPLIKLKRIQPDHKSETLQSPFFLIKTGPTIAAGCILVGLIDLSLISLLPVVVNRIPSAIDELAYLLPIAGALGTVVMQYPLAMLSEIIGNRRTAYIATTTGVSFCSLIPFFLDTILVSLTFAFVGCGLVYFMYTVSLAMLSERFKTDKLIQANASFIILFELSSLIGPILAGIFLDRSLNFGLSIFLIIVGSAYIFIAKIRDFQKSSKKFKQ